MKRAIMWRLGLLKLQCACCKHLCVICPQSVHFQPKALAFQCIATFSTEFESGSAHHLQGSYARADLLAAASGLPLPPTLGLGWRA